MKQNIYITFLLLDKTIENEQATFEFVFDEEVDAYKNQLNVLLKQEAENLKEVRMYNTQKVPEKYKKLYLEAAHDKNPQKKQKLNKTQVVAQGVEVVVSEQPRVISAEWKEIKAMKQENKNLCQDISEMQQAITIMATMMV